MEIKAKQQLLDILTSCPELKKQVKNISASWHDSKKGYPQVTVTQISNNPASYSDDMVDFKVALLQVDIWSKGNPFLVAGIIQETMLEAGYSSSDERERNEDTINRVILEYYLAES